MIVSMNVSHFVKICQVLTDLHQLLCRGVANFGTRCIWQHIWCKCVDMQWNAMQHHMVRHHNTPHMVWKNL